MPNFVTKKLENDSVTTAKASEGLKKKYFVFETFDHQPKLSAPNGYSDPSATAAVLNEARFRNGLFAQYAPIGAGQTLLGPLMDTTTGTLDVSQDQTDDEGVQYIFGGLTTGNPFKHTVPNLPTTVGSRPTEIALDLEIADVSGTDDCAFGFRKLEAVQANIDDYDEMAAINVISGTIFTETILNNGATVATSSGVTWADGARKRLRLTLDGRRVRYYVKPQGGTEVEINSGTVFRFDAGEVVVPFFYFLQTADLTTVNWHSAYFGRRRELSVLPD